MGLLAETAAEDGDPAIDGFEGGGLALVEAVDLAGGLAFGGSERLAGIDHGAERGGAPVKTRPPVASRPSFLASSAAWAAVAL